MIIKEILKEEIERIKLSDGEIKEIQKEAKELILKLKKEGLKSEIGGSLAKGTMIRKDIQDIDLFVLFDKEEEMEVLEGKLKKEGLKSIRIHGSRDYFQIKEKGKVFEIIPVLKLKRLNAERSGQNQGENIVKKTEKVVFSNVTDFSLEHVRYVSGKLKKEKKLAEEIMLAKSFCHANGFYGAESYIKGFSGYALELLIIHFGSFEKFLKGIEKGRYFDFEGKWKNEQEARREINASKLSSPIVLIDPTYKVRNAASSLSEETFGKFLKTTKEFLTNPNMNFFEKKELNINELKKFAGMHDAKLFSFSFNTDRQEGDIAGTKMKKFSDFVASQLERKEQKVLRKEFEYEGGKSAFAYFVIKEKKEIEVKGPPIANKKACEAFKKARKKIFPKGKNLWAREKVELKPFLQKLKNYEKDMGVKMNFSIT